MGFDFYIASIWSYFSLVPFTLEMAAEIYVKTLKNHQHRARLYFGNRHYNECILRTIYKVLNRGCVTVHEQ